MYCLCNAAETTGRLSAGSPTTSILQNSLSCDWSLDLVNNNNNNKRQQANWLVKGLNCEIASISKSFKMRFCEPFFAGPMRNPMQLFAGDISQWNECRCFSEQESQNRKPPEHCCAAEPCQATLGTEVLEREREREGGGGGIKTLGPNCHAISSNNKKDNRQTGWSKVGLLAGLVPKLELRMSVLWVGRPTQRTDILS